MRQIILITDGCSNEGMNPTIAAAHARQEGIIVNVVGIMDGGDLGVKGSKEVVEIAQAGGGLSRIVHTSQLAQTMQMMTRKTVMHTVQLAVRKELKGILGTSSLEDVPPVQRAEIVKVMDDLSERAQLQVALLVDVSASMSGKLAAVKDAIQDLLLSLKAREGFSQIAVFRYPSLRKQSGSAELDMGWSSDLNRCERLFQQLEMRGTTPTGPALMDVLHWMIHGEGCIETPSVETTTKNQAGGHYDRIEKGHLHEYVI